MKTYKSTLIVAIILFPILLIGQVKHEFKMNGLGVLKKSYSPSYELILNKKVGLEFQIGLNLSKRFLSDSISIFTTTGRITGQKFKQTRFLPGIALKYYFLQDFNGWGLFAGPQIKLDYLTHLDDNYYKRWDETRKSPSSILEGFKSFQYGVTLGGKYIFKSHFIFEFSGAALYAAQKIPEKLINYGPTLLLQLYSKLGYRF